MKDNWVFLNDQFIKEEYGRIHYKDLAIQRAYGVFDFLKVVDYKPWYLNDHLNRFFHSAESMHLKLKFTKTELSDIIQKLISKNYIPNYGVRMTLTGGYSKDGFQIGEPNLIVSTQIFKEPDAENYNKGIKLITYDYQRQLPEIKTIDYLMAIWLQGFIKNNKADDVLYIHNNKVTECPRSNIFLITKDKKLLTPRDKILKGITRQKIIEIAANDFEIIEGEVGKEDIANAIGAFITSTTKIILPVIQIDNILFRQNLNVLYSKLTSAYLQAIK